MITRYHLLIQRKEFRASISATITQCEDITAFASQSDIETPKSVEYSEEEGLREDHSGDGIIRGLDTCLTHTWYSVGRRPSETLGTSYTLDIELTATRN